MRKMTYRSILLKKFILLIIGMIAISNTYAIERIRWKMQHTGLAGQVKYIEAFANAGADIITIHPEATEDLQNSINKIKE